mgnify:FL=1
MLKTFSNKGEANAIPLNAENINFNFTDLDNRSISESGSNDAGRWIKFNDGTMITYQNVDITLSVTEAWGGIFVGNYATPISFPQVFQEPPEVLIDLKFTQGAGWRIDWDFPVITNSSIKNIGIGRGTASDESKCKATIFAIGKWK